MPEMSLKNHPQLVYISSNIRCSSSQVSACAWSCADNERPALAVTNSSREAVLSKTSEILSSLAAHGKVNRSLRVDSKYGMFSSRRKSRAARSGVRQRLCQLGSPPVWQPQSRIQRSTPCAQLHEVPSPRAPLFISMS